MRSSKVVAACMFNELQAVGLFLAFDSASTCTDPFTSGKKYRKSVNNAVFIRNESLFLVSAAPTSAFQLEHTSRLLRSVCPGHGGYRIRTIKHGKIKLCWSMGNTMDAYTRYIINSLISTMYGDVR